MNIYIGNISLRLKEDHIRQLFEAFGEVVSVRLITDRMTGLSKGIAFVEMKYKAEAESAIEKLNRCELDGKKMVVNYAKEPARNSKPDNNFRNKQSKK